MRICRETACSQPAPHWHDRMGSAVSLQEAHDHEHDSLASALAVDLAGMRAAVRALTPDRLFQLDDALTELTLAVDARIAEPGSPGKP